MADRPVAQTTLPEKIIVTCDACWGLGCEKCGGKGHMTGTPSGAALESTEWLRLEPGDASLLWGVLFGFHATQTAGGHWPRLERIISDLEVMIDRQEATRD